MMEQDVKAQHTPSNAAKRQACELANAAGNCDGWKPESDISAWPPMLALALHLDEVDRVVRAVAELPPTDTWRDTILRALMLPDPVDPDEELARVVMDAIQGGYGMSAEQLLVAAFKRLRDQGRLT